MRTTKEMTIKLLRRALLLPTIALLMAAKCGAYEPEFSLEPCTVELELTLSGLTASYGSYTLATVEIGVQKEPEAPQCNCSCGECCNNTVETGLEIIPISKTVSNGNNLFIFTVEPFSTPTAAELTVRATVTAKQENQTWIYEKVYEAGQKWEFEYFTTVKIAETFTQPTEKIER